MTAKQQQLIVLGAGPKAMAILAKSKVLTDLGWSVPRIIILEKANVGANWGGEFGFTDGEQLLGTPPDKDVGFPYDSKYWDPRNEDVNEAMRSFSWQSYLTLKAEYSKWIDQGKPPPRHKRWHEYLNWVSKKAGGHIRLGEVSEIDVDQGCWRVTCKASAGAHFTVEGGGLVVTGPGEPTAIDQHSDNEPRVTDGRSFWKHLRNKKFEGIKASFAIIGSGETAASVAVALTASRLQDGSHIYIVNRQGFVYTRSEGYPENKWFSDPEGWLERELQHRKEFIKRTDRSVFSPQAKSILDRADNIYYIPGDVTQITCSGSDNKVLLTINYGANEKKLECDYVIVAIGFDPLWFKRLLTERAILHITNVMPSWNKEDVELKIAEDLSVDGIKPRLHLPMIAGVAQGPGFPNLSCLGHMSDRILVSYV